ncbi:hypothetical protein Srot_2010 [Segniliparus rotundus DSM 44985]|uniref:DUF998 domain-containing protein n=1 Tax=Segniliparus rotundus (strain ATCC BAA-972 / CDC 1076 / CIP 108378 / DSM 44985 / JCM 13578) TaxID=640132 RepID=D6Z936_SEGRD|nr:hypothetical protein Srot_2010 [Segniliparus rotundus DSM 44985]
MACQKFPRAWALLWAAQIQFFLAYAVTLSAWTTPFRWQVHTISELEAPYCKRVGADAHWTCSPWHVVMQISFFAAGVLMAAGALLLPRQLAGRAMRALFVLAGAGLVVVSLTPRTENAAVHMPAAITSILLGNLGLVLLGWRGRQRLRWAGLAAAALGAVGLAGFAVTVASQILWAADQLWLASWFGAVERVAVYPTFLGMIVLGLGALSARPGGHELGDQPPAEQKDRRRDAGDEQEAPRHALPVEHS